MVRGDSRHIGQPSQPSSRKAGFSRKNVDQEIQEGVEAGGLDTKVPNATPDNATLHGSVTEEVPLYLAWSL